MNRRGIPKLESAFLDSRINRVKIAGKKNQVWLICTAVVEKLIENKERTYYISTKKLVFYYNSYLSKKEQQWHILRVWNKSDCARGPVDLSVLFLS